MEQKDKHFSLRIPADLLEALKHVAKEDGRSINTEIVWVIRKYIAERKGGKQNDTQSL